MECICLAGGLGKRLQPMLPDTPKCLAPVAGIPFLDLLIERLRTQGVHRLILSLGHLHNQVVVHIHGREVGMEIDFCIEPEPLGTAGALKAALAMTREEAVAVVNGDTWYEVDLQAMLTHHRGNAADVTLALKPMHDFERFGRVEIQDGIVTGFFEKQPCHQGLINGGTYIVNRDIRLPMRGSFENDYLAMPGHRVCGLVQDGTFIDIGIPEDYARAQSILDKALSTNEADDSHHA